MIDAANLAKATRIQEGKEKSAKLRALVLIQKSLDGMDATSKYLIQANRITM